MEATTGDAFASNVFVNCPFDKEYDSLLKPLLFTIVSIGLNPRIASERIDSGEQRISKICDLIKESRYSIHDISRLKSTEAGEYYRMNMPFELGVDYGVRVFLRGKYIQKRFLILESIRYEYMRALSDLNGVDIQAHGDEPLVLIRKVRNWFSTSTRTPYIKSPTIIWYDYADFTADLYAKLKASGFSDDDIDELPVPEYLDYVRRWLVAGET